MIDGEQATIAWLTPRYSAARILTDPGNNLASNTVRVLRIGGTVLQPGVSRPNVDIDVWHTDRIAAKQLCDDICDDLVENGPGSSIPGITDGAMHRVHVTSAPAWRPWSDTNFWRFGMTVAITFRGP